METCKPWSEHNSEIQVNKFRNITGWNERERESSTGKPRYWKELDLRRWLLAFWPVHGSWWCGWLFSHSHYRKPLPARGWAGDLWGCTLILSDVQQKPQDGEQVVIAVLLEAPGCTGLGTEYQMTFTSKETFWPGIHAFRSLHTPGLSDK